MASANGKAKDGGVTVDQLKAVEYELRRSKTIEENDKRLAAGRATRASMQEDMEANQAPKKKRKAPSSAPVSANEGRVLRSRVSKDQDHVDPEHQPSKDMIAELVKLTGRPLLLIGDLRYLSAIAKKNRANAVPHTSGSKSHARVAHQPMKMIALLVWMCFYMHGLVLKLLLLRQQLSQLIQTLLWAKSPSDQLLMRKDIQEDKEGAMKLEV